MNLPKPLTIGPVVIGLLVACGSPQGAPPAPVASKAHAVPTTTPAPAGPVLAFTIREGKTENRFFRQGKVAAHLLATSGDAPRIVVAFPAGNMGIGLWFDGAASEVSVDGQLEAVERPDGMRGVSATVRLKGANLRVKTALLGSVRVLRNLAVVAIVPPELEHQTTNGPPVVLRRTTLDGGHHLEVALDGVKVERDGNLALASADTALRLTALADDEPLTPLPTDAVLTPEASDDPRAREALTFLSYQEKILAGSWQYLTYFGRDTMLSTRLLMPVLRPAIVEAALGSVIERLSPDGEVAHEEDIGEWAVAENMKRAPQPKLLERGAREKSSESRGASAAEALTVKDVRQPGYDYKMVDDDFLLAPILEAHLGNDSARATAFFGRKTLAGRSYGEAVRKNLDRVLAQAEPFAAKPTHGNLIHIGEGLSVGNWRDSIEGLGNGRVPYDVNAALVPAALRAAEKLYPLVGGDKAKRAGELARAWMKAEPLFRVRIEADDAKKRLTAYGAEQKIDVRDATAAIKGPVTFPALSLDASGRPVPIQHSDDGFVLMFTEPSAEWLREAAQRIAAPFPAGLRTPVGIVVANPAYVTDPSLRKIFTRDHYHGTVVWSWQQAMLLAGVRRQLARTDLPTDARKALENASSALASVIEATRPQRTSELWSFSVDAQGYHVVPFGQSAGHHTEANAVQLWSTVYLALDGKVK